jgi:Arc/MetJ-type ribon-helix-helix transcriptional regulator
MTNLVIAMSDGEKECIDAQVAAGSYANASDYISELIRHERASLATLVEGIASLHTLLAFRE